MSRQNNGAQAIDEATPLLATAEGAVSIQVEDTHDPVLEWIEAKEAEYAITQKLAGHLKDYYASDDCQGDDKPLSGHQLLDAYLNSTEVELPTDLTDFLSLELIQYPIARTAYRKPSERTAAFPGVRSNESKYFDVIKFMENPKTYTTDRFSEKFFQDDDGKTLSYGVIGDSLLSDAGLRELGEFLRSVGILKPEILFDTYTLEEKVKQLFDRIELTSSRRIFSALSGKSLSNGIKLGLSVFIIFLIDMSALGMKLRASCDIPDIEQKYNASGMLNAIGSCNDENYDAELAFEDWCYFKSGIPFDFEFPSCDSDPEDRQLFPGAYASLFAATDAYMVLLWVAFAITNLKALSDVAFGGSGWIYVLSHCGFLISVCPVIAFAMLSAFQVIPAFNQIDSEKLAISALCGGAYKLFTSEKDYSEITREQLLAATEHQSCHANALSDALSAPISNYILSSFYTLIMLYGLFDHLAAASDKSNENKWNADIEVNKAREAKGREAYQFFKPAPQPSVLRVTESERVEQHDDMACAAPAPSMEYGNVD